jgi:hypothetical protein
MGCIVNALSALGISVMAVACCAAQGPPDPLSIRTIDAPLQFEDAPLSRVIGTIGVCAEPDFVLISLEEEIEAGKEPLVSVTVPGGIDVREALTRVLAFVPSYSFEVVAPHLINVFSVPTRGKPNHLTNLPVAAVRLTNMDPSEFLLNATRYLPELREAVTGSRDQTFTIGPGLTSKRPGPDVDLNGFTVRDDLNLVSEVSIRSAERGESPAFSWLYQHDSKPLNGSSAHTWRILAVWDPAKHKKQ